MKPTTMVAFALIFAFMLSSVGCVDINLTKHVFIKPKRTVEVYNWSILGTVSHEFITNVSNVLSEARYTKTLGFDVMPKTMKLKLQVKVNMFRFSPEQIPELPGPIGDIIKNLTDNISEYLRNAERHVDITLKGPGGQIILLKQYNESIDDRISIDYPISGDWILEIDATGVGLSETYRDSFSITISAYVFRGTKEV